ncbi:AMP-binding protein [Cupriavidus necator]|uniref:AMP-binding protein n=1 Tax=Cupriavidus necator TaxID=106590 RepID=UPI0003174C8E|nr:AMP-binding protein [Cupriavidus necator]MDX6008149.1 AMP-binding protein [Cupriavidus necator]
MHSLARAVEEAGDKPFIECGGKSMTFREFDRASTRLAHSLAALGVSAGHSVVTFMESSLDVYLCWFAINKLGAIWCPVNTAYRKTFLRHQVDDSLAALAICDAELVDRFHEIDDQLPIMKLILVRGDVPEQECAIPMRSLDDYRGADDTPIPLTAKPSDLSCLIYTSGTTGLSKGCMIPYASLYNVGIQTLEAIPVESRDILWTCLPLFHMSAISSVTQAALQMQVRLSICPQFSVSGFWEEIERSGAAHALLMGSIFPLVAKAPDTEAMKRCHGQLRSITGVPITPEIGKIWKERFGVGYLNSYGYGQSEGAKLAHLVYGEPLPPPLSSGHIAHDDYEVIIADENDNPLLAGTPGEILFRPRKPHIMFSGYWRRPEDSAKVWRNLWMHTGDIGKIDEDGWFYFLDRKKDYIRSRGENISSFEVEATYMTHPAIAEVAFHGVILEEGGEEQIKVTAVIRDGHSLAHEALCRWSMESLPYFAVPRFYEFRDALPKTPTGRVQKYKLREDGCTPVTWDAWAIGLIAKKRAA